MKGTTFVFNGQLTELLNLAKYEYANNLGFKKEFDRLSELFREDLKSICWGSRERALKTSPYFAHLGLFTVGMAKYLALGKSIEGPRILTGFGLGELMAVTGSGYMSLEEGASLVSFRGRLLERNDHHNEIDTLLLNGERNDIASLLHHLRKICSFYISHLLGEKYTAVALSRKFIARLMPLIIANRISAVRMLPGYGTHSVFMKSISSQIREYSRNIPLQESGCMVYSPVQGKMLMSADDVCAALKAHLMTPVDWHRAVSQLYANGCRDFVLIGYSRMLKDTIVSGRDDLVIHNAIERILRKVA